VEKGKKKKERVDRINGSPPGNELLDVCPLPKSFLHSIYVKTVIMV
jgi:hypothetical protein